MKQLTPIVTIINITVLCLAFLLIQCEIMEYYECCETPKTEYTTTTVTTTPTIPTTPSTSTDSTQTSTQTTNTNCPEVFSATIQVNDESGDPIIGASIQVKDLDTGQIILTSQGGTAGNYTIYTIPSSITNPVLHLEVTLTHQLYETYTSEYYVLICGSCCNCPPYIEFVIGNTQVTMIERECIDDPFMEYHITVVNDFGTYITDATVTVSVQPTNEILDMSSYPNGAGGAYTIFTDDQLAYIQQVGDPLMIWVTISKSGYEIVIREYQFTINPASQTQCFDHIGLYSGNMIVELSLNNN